MRVSAHTKSRYVDLVELTSGFALRVGAFVVIVTAAYLIYAALGGSAKEAAKMTPADRAEFVRGVQLLVTALTWASGVVVASVVVRLPNDESVGQFLSLIGALLFFASPAAFGYFAGGAGASGNSVLASIVNGFRTVGAMALVAGMVLVVRDAILRIWAGVSDKRIEARCWGDEDELRKKPRRPKLYGSCWDMSFCRGFVRRVCPAWEEKRACWRMKVGCYCDEKTILTAMTSMGSDNEHVRGIMYSLGLNQPRDSLLNARQRRARCRRCMIYAEHQRQKYRILSPLVFPAVGLVMYVFYERIYAWLWVVLEKTDKFIRVLTLKVDTVYSFADDGRVLTILAMVWLGVILLSYAIRTLEYLVFELQV